MTADDGDEEATRHGFNCPLYEMDEDDCAYDLMLCTCKPELEVAAGVLSGARTE
jgi:hypothetical protein